MLPWLTRSLPQVLNHGWNCSSAVPIHPQNIQKWQWGGFSRVCCSREVFQHFKCSIRLCQATGMAVRIFKSLQLSKQVTTNWESTACFSSDENACYLANLHYLNTAFLPSVQTAMQFQDMAACSQAAVWLQSHTPIPAGQWMLSEAAGTADDCTSVHLSCFTSGKELKLTGSILKWMFGNRS